MKMRARVTRALSVALLGLGLAGALPAAFPGTAAATEATSHLAAHAALLPPTLTKATYDGDNVIALYWDPSSTADGTEFYDILADGRQVEQVEAQQNGSSILGCAVLLDRTGASPTATYTVVAEGTAGDRSAPSNGLVPVNERPLPKPVMRSAVVSGDEVTFTWDPTVTDAPPVTYHVIVDGGYGWGSVTDQTSLTTSRSKSFDTGPTGPVTVTINPGSSVVVYAVDGNGEQSPWSDPIQVTEG